MIKKDMSFIYIYKILSIFFICIIALNSVYAEEVNVYSARKGYLLEPLIQAFEKDTASISCGSVNPVIVFTVTLPLAVFDTVEVVTKVLAFVTEVIGL